MLLGTVTGEDASLTGEMTYYGRGVMEQVLTNRLAWGHVTACPECIGMVALLDRQHVGKRVYLQRPGHGIEGPYLVVDCAAAKDYRRLLLRGLVGEVDWQTSRRWQMRGPVYGVRVVFQDP